MKHSLTSLPVLDMLLTLKGEYCYANGIGVMSIDNSFVALSETEFEQIKSRLTNLPKDPHARFIAIAQAINDVGIRENRLYTVFDEVSKRLPSPRNSSTLRGLI